MINFLESSQPSISHSELENIHRDVKSLTDELIEYNNNLPSLNEVREGLEEVDKYLKILSMHKEDRVAYIKLNDLSHGLEDVDEAVATIKKAAIAMIKFIIGLLDRVIKFIASFFNKGMTLTEKLFLASIIRKRDSLERAIDEKNLNKNKPLDLKENVLGKILKRRDLLILEGFKNHNEINPTLIINYARSTLTLFTDNLTMFDNTCDTLINMVKDIKETTVTNSSFVGYASEKNKYLETTLSPLRQAFKRNELLNNVVNIGTKKYARDNYNIYICPLPRKGKNENKMGYVAIGVLKHDILSKMKYEDIKSMEDLLFSKLDYVDYKDLGINPDKIDSIKIKSASFTEIDTIVSIFTDASEKIKKKYKPEKMTNKLEKIKKQMTTVNVNEFDSKVSNFKIQYINTGITIATTLVQSSTELYSSGYCDSIKDYIEAHTV